MRNLSAYISILLINISLYSVCNAQENLPLKVLGNLKTKSAKEIQTSRWSIGGETLDRDYAKYSAYQSYLGPLGAKRIRLQGGWAKCEKIKGQYNFAWLDEVINDAISQGVFPWLQTSYGNPIYAGGGQETLAGGIPTSEEALHAWDNWVRALVTRYKNRVKEWEIWNEPDISKQMTAKDFSVFFVRTVKIVKEVDPKARIIALGLAGVGNTQYVTDILDILKAENKLDDINAISFHGYQSRPENIFLHIRKLQTIVKNYNENMEMWQGENGAPTTAEGISIGALSHEDWNETTQA
ncbi:MAG: hypothetical protein PHS30_02420, partial [Bacteroidales bacterium]|nr:hypothetical protein [Bacteroidales bacterium]